MFFTAVSSHRELSKHYGKISPGSWRCLADIEFQMGVNKVVDNFIHHGSITKLLHKSKHPPLLQERWQHTDWCCSSKWSKVWSPALPVGDFLTPQKSGRLGPAQRQADFNTINNVLVESYIKYNDRCLHRDKLTSTPSTLQRAMLWKITGVCTETSWLQHHQHCRELCQEQWQVSAQGQADFNTTNTAESYVKNNDRCLHRDKPTSTPPTLQRAMSRTMTGVCTETSWLQHHQHYRELCQEKWQVSAQRQADFNTTNTTESYVKNNDRCLHRDKLTSTPPTLQRAMSRTMTGVCTETSWLQVQHHQHCRQLHQEQWQVSAQRQADFNTTKTAENYVKNNDRCFQVPVCHNAQYKNLFLPSTIESNCLNNDMLHTDSVATFKLLTAPD